MPTKGADQVVSYCNNLKYQIKGKSLAFCCSGLEEDNRSDKNNNAVGELLDGFLLELSGDRKIFFHGYRLPSADEGVLIDPEVILERAEVLMNPFESFLWLERAKVRSIYFGRACETDIYYFNPKVKWTDFLASAFQLRPMKLVEEGILAAHFSSGEHGAEFHFECGKAYEGRVRELIQGMEGLGYQIKRSIWV